MTVSKEQAPTREALASLLAALHYCQYSTNEDEKSLRRSIECALKNYDIGAGQFIEQSQDSGHAAALTDELLRKARETLSEAADYVSSPTWSPSMARDCRDVADKIDRALAAPAPTQQPSDGAIYAAVSRAENPELHAQVMREIGAALSGAAPTPQPELTLPEPIGKIFADGYWNLNPKARKDYDNFFGGADVYTAEQVRSLLGAAPTQAPQQPVAAGVKENRNA